MRTDSDHNPWKRVAEDFLLNDATIWDRVDRLAARLYEVDRNPAVAWPQHTRSNFDNSRKSGRIANRPDAPWAVSRKNAKVFCSQERAYQGLACRRRTELVAVALRVQRAVEVIARVRVPMPISPWHHDEDLALPRTPDP